MSISAPGLAAVAAARQRIGSRIEAVRAQLARASQFPEQQPWLSFNRVQRVQDLASPRRSLREALAHDLAVLHMELRSLDRLQRQLVRGQVRVREREMRRRLRELAQGAARAGGSIDDTALRAVMGEAAAVLDDYVEIMRRNPTPGSIGDVLEVMAVLMIGGHEDAVPGTWNALARAGSDFADRSERAFRGHPTARRLAQRVDAVALGQMLGASPSPLGQLPAGVEAAGNRPHVVAPGESLSSIARDYYCRADCWDVIYLNNPDAVGRDPTRLAVDTALTIP